MKYLYRLLIILLLLLAVPAGGIAYITYAKADMSQLPTLESGDLIFQTHLSSQAPAVMLASASLYSHVGIVHKQGKHYTVIHAAKKVVESSLKDFIEIGWGERFTVMRYSSLTPAQKEAIVSHARAYLQRGYDIMFNMYNETIYCSELPYLAYKGEHITLGKVQKISELYLDNAAVRELFKRRWKNHPSCQSPSVTAESCWKIVLEEPIITPASVAEDANLKLIYSNYGF